jgi:hypothetical protein
VQDMQVTGLEKMLNILVLRLDIRPTRVPKFPNVSTVMVPDIARVSLLMEVVCAEYFRIIVANCTVLLQVFFI